MEKKTRMIWLAYLEPRQHMVVGLWRPNVYRVPADVAGDIRDSLIRMQALAVLASTEEEALARVDDLRQRCSVCEEGHGTHRCDSCGSAVLIGQLDMSVHGSAHGGAR